MRPQDKRVWRSVLLLVALASASGRAAPDERTPTVGAWGRIDGLLLPGSELRAKPIVDERTPIVVRIAQAFPHGTAGYRYDLEFFGTVPGPHDLRDYLERMDGSDTGTLPAIPVEVLSLLPPGQVEPHPLDSRSLQRFGGYRFLATLALILWLWVLCGLILLGWRRQSAARQATRPPSLAELLRPRLQAALENRLPAVQYAELERMLLAFWQRRLGLANVAPDEAIRRIRDDAVAGPLLRQLETWMHSPRRDPSFDLAELLRPLEQLSAEDFEVPPPTELPQASRAGGST